MTECYRIELSFLGQNRRLIDIARDAGSVRELLSVGEITCGSRRNTARAYNRSWALGSGFRSCAPKLMDLDPGIIS